MRLLHSFGLIHGGASNPLLRLTQIILLNDATEGIGITCDGRGKITRILESDRCLDAFVPLRYSPDSDRMWSAHQAALLVFGMPSAHAETWMRGA